MFKTLVLAVFVGTCFSAPAFSATYEIDHDHSSITFKIRHLVSKTKGEFKKFKGTFQYEKGKSETWSVNADIDASSIDTNSKKRDDHLRSKDFFDVAKYPKITFKSTKIMDASSTEAKVEGELTMHGVTKPVELELEIGGEGKDPWGNERVGFTAKTKVNRKDFNIVYNKTLETGGVLIGDDVEITLEVEGLKKSTGLASTTASKKDKKAKK